MKIKSMLYVSLFITVNVFFFQNCSPMSTTSGASILSSLNDDVDEPIPSELTTYANVKDFGATGNGYTDETVAVRAAIQSLEKTKGGVVYFPRGYYTVSDTIELPSNTVIQGESSRYAGYSQIRLGKYGNAGLDAQDKALFLIRGGTANIEIRDVEIRSMTPSIQVVARNDYARIESENTAGVRLQSDGPPIKNISVENVRLVNFTNGIEASGTDSVVDPLISDVRIRSVALHENFQGLLIKTMNANNWDIQNLNVVEMGPGQTGVNLLRTGKLSLFQLSCASTLHNAKLCVKIERHNGLHFTEMHVEGPAEGFVIAENSSTDAPIVFENVAAGGEIKAPVKIVLIGNRMTAEVAFGFKFINAGRNADVYSCGNVWISGPANTHLTHTEVNLGLSANTVKNCPLNLPSIKASYSTGTQITRAFLPYSGNVRNFGAVGNGVHDDTTAVRQAISAGGVFFPAGEYRITDTLVVPEGTIIQGAPGAVVVLDGNGKSLFKTNVVAGIMNQGVVIRDLELKSKSLNQTTGIEISGVIAASGDMQFNNLKISDFGNGIWVHARDYDVNGQPLNQPQVDTVSAKNLVLSGNNIGFFLNDDNASNWNFENLKIIDIKLGQQGFRFDRGGHIAFRDFYCKGAPGLSTLSPRTCLQMVRTNGLFVSGLRTENMETAIQATWEMGHTPFPWVLRDSDLRAGVQLEGRIFLTSIGNTYGPIHVLLRDAVLGAQVSRVYTCGDQFLNGEFLGLAPTHFNYITQALDINLRRCQ